jgi:tryptophanyl-tRNA synthetase
MGLLERCHSYKDKVASGVAPSHALFAYPVLMAADILSFQANTVPVGQDQKQHIEVTRDIAIKFNNAYGEVFTVPEPSIRAAVAVVPGIDGRKMSKSYDNHLELFGSPKETKSRVMKIVTDSTPLEDPKDPDTCNVFALYKLFASSDQCDALGARYRAGGMGYGDAKKALLELATETFAPLRQKREALATDPAYVQSVLEAGAEKARVEARRTLSKARQVMGLE